MNSVDAQAKAMRLSREARHHKRASRRHRDRARELKQQLDELVAACAKRGITITINAQPEGGHSGITNEVSGEGSREPAAASRR